MSEYYIDQALILKDQLLSSVQLAYLTLQRHSLPYVNLVLEQSMIASYDYDSIDWKNLVIYFIVSIYTFELYLEFRQRQRMNIKTIPKALSKVIKHETLLKSNAYNIDKWNFKLVSGVYDRAQIIGAIYYNFLPLAWKYSGELLEKFDLQTEILQSLVFAAGLILLNTILNIPPTLISAFVVEARHGFNKQTYATFFLDIVKTLALTTVIGMPVLAAFLSIVMWAGDNFAIYVFLFMLFFQLFFILIFPTYIQPLFNKFTPLEEGTLKVKIDALASKFKFPLTEMFVVDGSTRSAHSNAYFFGFFKNKRIVLYDTLLEKTTDDEIVAVLGHWYHSHVFYNLLIAQVHIFVLFYLFSICIKLESLYTSFGFSSTPILIGFMLFQFVYSPVESVIGFMMNYLTRCKEFQADAFAKKHGYASKLKSALVKLHTENLSIMQPDWLHSMWHLSHPPIVERLAAIDGPTK